MVAWVQSSASRVLEALQVGKAAVQRLELVWLRQVVCGFLRINWSS